MPITSPLDITGCNLWLDTKDLASVTKTGNNITALTDKSPAARHITTAIGSPRHGLRSYNGHPVVNLVPADSLESGTHTDLPQPSTIFFVGGFDSDTDGMSLFKSSWSGHLRFTRNSTGFHRLSINGGGISATPSPLTGTLTTIVMDGGSSSIDVDGVVTAGNLGTVGPGNKEIVGAACDGWFCQYIRFDSVLSPTQIQDVKDWLSIYLADNAVRGTMLPPSGYGKLKMKHLAGVLPADSIMKVSTYILDEWLVFKTTATHSDGSTGTVTVDEFAVPTIVGTSDAGVWTIPFRIKDEDGLNTAFTNHTITIGGG